MAILVKIVNSETGELIREVSVDENNPLVINPGESVILVGLNPDDVDIQVVGNDLVVRVGSGEPIVFQEFALYLKDGDIKTTLTIGDGADTETITNLGDLEQVPGTPGTPGAPSQLAAAPGEDPEGEIETAAGAPGARRN